MSEIPAEAIIAAAKAIVAIADDFGSGDLVAIDYATAARAAVEAAAPLIVSHREAVTAGAIAKAERERIRSGIAAITQQPAFGNSYVLPEHLAALLTEPTEG